MKQSINQQINQTTNQSTDQSINQSAVGSKRSATPEEDADAVVAKKLKVAKETSKLEEYYYATLQV